MCVTVDVAVRSNQPGTMTLWLKRGGSIFNIAKTELCVDHVTTILLLPFLPLDLLHTGLFAQSLVSLELRQMYKTCSPGLRRRRNHLRCFCKITLVSCISSLELVLLTNTTRWGFAPLCTVDEALYDLLEAPSKISNCSRTAWKTCGQHVGICRWTELFKMKIL